MRPRLVALLSLLAASCAQSPPPRPAAMDPASDPDRFEKAPYRYCLSNLLALHEGALADALVNPTCVSRSGKSKSVYVRSTFEIGTTVAALQAYNLGLLDAATRFGAEQLRGAASDRAGDGAKPSAHAADPASRSNDCLNAEVERLIRSWGEACGTAAAHLDHDTYALGFSTACRSVLQRTDCDAQEAAALARVDQAHRAELGKSIADLNKAIQAFTRPH